MGESKLTELLQRVKAAHETDRRIDRDLSVLPGGPNWVRRKDGHVAYFRHSDKGDDGRAWAFTSGADRDNFGCDLNDHAWPYYTSSIDAALALTERVLPGAEMHITLNHPKNDWQTASIRVAPLKLVSGEEATLPLAIIAATLSALIALEAQQ